MIIPIYAKNKERILPITKIYYRKNKEKIKKLRCAYYKNNKVSILIRNKDWVKKNREKDSLRRNGAYFALRMKVIKIMGGKCNKCGIADFRCLQIDHINGGGRKEYNKSNPYKYLRLIVNKFNKEKYQLLCANCNWIKKYERREVNFKYPIEIEEI